MQYLLSGPRADKLIVGTAGEVNLEMAEFAEYGWWVNELESRENGQMLGEVVGEDGGALRQEK